jgi:hypothetical protein
MMGVRAVRFGDLAPRFCNAAKCRIFWRVLCGLR